MTPTTSLSLNPPKSETKKHAPKYFFPNIHIKIIWNSKHACTKCSKNYSKTIEKSTSNKKWTEFSKKFKTESQNTGQERKNRGENLPDLKHIRG